MEKYDVIVVGGGLLGCFAARNLSRYKIKTALLEKREELCTGISRANTAIVYSGCDTKPNTLKTSMCVRASQGFADLCGELGVRYSPCGSIMVSFGERGTNVLKKKLEQGRENAVRGLKLLSPEEVLELEPNLAKNVALGLYAPDTGTVMPWELCLAAAENASQNGADIILNSQVTDIERNGDGWLIRCHDKVFYARAVVNCAGLSADKLHETALEPKVRIVPTAGDYFVLDTKTKGHVKHVLFHEPEEKGKGLTVVPTVDGNILVGPTERPADGGFYETAHEGMELLRSLVSEILPSLPMEHVIRSFGALRPNPYMLHRDESGAMKIDDKSVGEFCIITSDDSTFISFVGIKTPGLTCANELGIYAADMLAKRLCAVPKPNFNPRREPPVRLNELSLGEREKLAQLRPDYGRIVCRCGDVSEGEIIDAIHRFPGASTNQGVKHRAGTGLGRCQGSFCAQSVCEILAREHGHAPDQAVNQAAKQAGSDHADI